MRVPALSVRVRDGGEGAVSGSPLGLVAQLLEVGLMRPAFGVPYVEAGQGARAVRVVEVDDPEDSGLFVYWAKDESPDGGSPIVAQCADARVAVAVVHAMLRGECDERLPLALDPDHDPEQCEDPPRAWCEVCGLNHALEARECQP